MKELKEIIKNHDIYSVNLKKQFDILQLIYYIFNFSSYYISHLIKKEIKKQNISNIQGENLKILLENTPEISSNVLNIIKTKWNDINIFISFINTLSEKTDVITIAFEEKYIDRDYRDSYYMHYSEEHSEICRFCNRLLFFQNDYVKDLNKVKICDKAFKKLKKDFIGSMVIRPTAGSSIGRTLISPFYLLDLKGAYVRWTEYTIYYRGCRFSVNAFPFRMQDMVTTTCAEITLMNIFDYYSKQYVDYKYLLPSEIYKICKQQNNDRVIPTEGITYKTISKIFYEFGFAPKLYVQTSNKTQHYLNDITLFETLNYYVESGMPVAVGLDYGSLGHSIVCIGHGRKSTDFPDRAVMNTKQMYDNGVFYINSAELYDEFIFQDDSQRPYIKRSRNLNNNSININSKPVNINCIVAPLHRRMYMDAVVAKKVIINILSEPSYTPYSPEKESIDISKPGLTSNNPIVFRLFLASSRHFKESRLKNIKNKWLFDLYQEIPMPHFIWVCELYTKKGYLEKRPFGDIVLDATFPAQENSFDSFLLLCYPERVIAKNPDGSSLFYNTAPMEWIKNYARLDSIYLFSSYEQNLHIID